MSNIKLNKIMKSTRKNKKYMIKVKNPETGRIKTIHWGDSRYGHFKDKTPLKLYKHLDHGDKERRKRYYQRHGKATSKYTAKYYSHKYLW